MYEFLFIYCVIDLFVDIIILNLLLNIVVFILYYNVVIYYEIKKFLLLFRIVFDINE